MIENRLFFRFPAAYLIIMLLTVGFFYLPAWSKICISFRDGTEEALMSYARIVDRNSWRKSISRTTIGAISMARVTLIGSAKTPAFESQN